MNDKHILLVEDDETLQALIEKLLVNNNYLVSKAVNIEEAIKILEKATYFTLARTYDPYEGTFWSPSAKSESILNYQKGETLEIYNSAYLRYFPLQIGNEWTYVRKRGNSQEPVGYRFIDFKSECPKTKNQNSFLLTMLEPVENRKEKYIITSESEIGFNVEVKTIMNNREFECNNGINPIEFGIMSKLNWGIRTWGKGKSIMEFTEGNYLGCAGESREILAYFQPKVKMKGVDEGVEIYSEEIHSTIQTIAGSFSQILKVTILVLPSFKEGGLVGHKTVRYFAKDIGLVYEEKFDSSGKLNYSLELISYKII